MKSSKYSDSAIMAILKQAESGVLVPQLCRECGMSSATFYKWRSKFGGMDASLISRLRELEHENARLKKMYADVQLDAHILKEALAKKYSSHLSESKWLKRLRMSTSRAYGASVLCFKWLKAPGAMFAKKTLRMNAWQGSCRV